jgi:uncharacterized membrane protein YeaQ/YmgE (transglycosylase-associated protein family)
MVLQPLHGYLLLCVPFLGLALFLYLISPRTRKEQIVMSILVGIIGPVSERLYLADYWFPQSVWTIHMGSITFFIEDVLFGLSIGGIGAVIFEVVFRQHFRRAKVKKHISMIVVGTVGAIVLFGSYLAGINSIYASALCFGVMALFIVMLRKDLLADAFGSSLLVGIVLFFSYKLMYSLFPYIGEEFLRTSWYLYNTGLGTRVWGVPITEIVWALAWGLFAGPVYEYSRNLKNK